MSAASKGADKLWNLVSPTETPIKFLEENVEITVRPNCTTESIALTNFPYLNSEESIHVFEAVGDLFSMDTPSFSYCDTPNFSFWVDTNEGNRVEQTWVNHDTDTNQIILTAGID